MNENIRNVKTSMANVVGLVTTTMSVTTKVVADMSSVAISAVEHTPGVLKSTVQLPFAAGTGYLMESEGVDYAVAHKRAYAVVEQPLDITIEAAGIALGSAIAKGWESLNEEEVKSSK